MTSSTSVSSFPLNIGTDQDFARVRSLLDSASYNEANVCDLLKIRQMSDVSTVSREILDLNVSSASKLGVLIRVFLFLDTISTEQAEHFMGSETVESLLALDLFRRTVSETTAGSGNPGYYSSVWLYPIGEMLVTSDRSDNPDDLPLGCARDPVFPALYPGTFLFLKLVSQSPALDVLDLCCGSGVGALMLSRHATQAVASDISLRATHFVRFNARLNGCDNLQAVQSDFYSAFEGQSFDRILAHPPYVPSISNEVVWRDGGETGETPMRRIVEGLSQYLRPGGTFYSVCAGFDCTNSGFEARVRNWLGESHDDFDLIFAFNREKSIRHLATELVERNPKAIAADVSRWEEVFKKIGAVQHVHGGLVIHRRRPAQGATRIPLTLRTRLSDATDGSSFEQAFRWHHWLARPQADQELSQLKPRLSSQLQVRVTHVVSDRSLVPAEFVLESARPFLAETRVDSWIAQVVSELDGSLTLTEFYQKARTAAILPETIAFSDFLKLALNLIERGYLEVDDAVFTE
jgi:SAM-dependent methyltransferase